MFAAPLLISADMIILHNFSVSLLRNARLLARNQDKGGHQAEFVRSQNDLYGSNLHCYVDWFLNI